MRRRTREPAFGKPETFNLTDGLGASSTDIAFEQQLNRFRVRGRIDALLGRTFFDVKGWRQKISSVSSNPDRRLLGFGLAVAEMCFELPVGVALFTAKVV